MSSGTIDEVKGRAKEAAGAVLGAQQLEREGRADQLAGKVKDAAETAIDEATALVKDE